MNRILYLDRLKAVGIFLVVFYHTILLTKQNRLAETMNIISLVMLPAFYFVSGELKGLKVPSKTVNLRSFVRKRTTQLIVPYLIMSILAIIFQCLLTIGSNHYFHDVGYSVVRFFLLQGVQVTWFLPVLFFAEILFQLFRRQLKASLVVSGLLIILSVHFYMSVSFVNGLTLLMLREFSIFINSLIAFFVMGMGYLYQTYDMNRKIMGVITSFIVVLIVMPSYLAIKFGIDLHYLKFVSVMNFLEYLFLSLGMVVLTQAALKLLEDVSLPVIDWIGQNSLFIMGIHLGVWITQSAVYFLVQMELETNCFVLIFVTILEIIVMFPLVVVLKKVILFIQVKLQAIEFVNIG